MNETLLQSVHGQDTLTGRLLDSVVVDSPVPDPLVPLVQFLFQQPGWLMATGMVVGAILGLAVLVALWKKRSAIAEWFGTRDRGAKLAMVGTAAVLLLLMGGAGLAANNYMMNDNDFCRGCHIFIPSGQAFVRPDTGNYLLVNKVEGAHDSLSCHACHPFERARDHLRLRDRGLQLLDDLLRDRSRSVRCTVQPDQHRAAPRRSPQRVVGSVVQEGAEVRLQRARPVRQHDATLLHDRGSARLGELHGV